MGEPVNVIWLLSVLDGVVVVLVVVVVLFREVLRFREGLASLT